MKKVTYLLALVFALTLMSFSCTEKEDDPLTSGELYPAYVGVWECDSTNPARIGDKLAYQWDITINDVNATLYSVDINVIPNDIISTTNYLWTVSGNELMFNNETNTNPINFMVVSAPTEYNMVLKRDNVIYYLSK